MAKMHMSFLWRKFDLNKPKNAITNSNHVCSGYDI